MKNEVHRGRSKDGKKAITIHLTDEEYEALKRIAETEFRTAVSQSAYLVVKEISRMEKQ